MQCCEFTLCTQSIIVLERRVENVTFQGNVSGSLLMYSHYSHSLPKLCSVLSRINESFCENCKTPMFCFSLFSVFNSHNINITLLGVQFYKVWQMPRIVKPPPYNQDTELFYHLQTQSHVLTD